MSFIGLSQLLFFLFTFNCFGAVGLVYKRDLRCMKFNVESRQILVKIDQSLFFSFISILHIFFSTLQLVDFHIVSSKLMSQQEEYISANDPFIREKRKRERKLNGYIFRYWLGALINLLIYNYLQEITRTRTHKLHKISTANSCHCRLTLRQSISLGNQGK